MVLKRCTFIVLATASLAFGHLSDVEAAEKKKGSIVFREMVEIALEKACPELEFKDGVDLKQAIAPIIKELAIDGVHAIDDTVELELEGLETLSDVSLPGLAISEGSHSIRDALKLIFEQTSEPAMTFVPRDGHVLITSLAKAESDEMLETRVYDVSDLLLPVPSGAATERKGTGSVSSRNSETRQQNPDTEPKASGKKGRRKRRGKQKPDVLKQFGASVPPSSIKKSNAAPGGKIESLAYEIVFLVMQHTSPPARWIDNNGEGGSITLYGQFLVVRQTYATHFEIEKLLRKLRTLLGDGGELRNHHWPAFSTPSESGPQGGGIQVFGPGGAPASGSGFFSTADPGAPLRSLLKK